MTGWALLRSDWPLLDDSVWWRLLRLTGRDCRARMVDCRRCKVPAGEPCVAGTGLQASEPCPVRLADAQEAAA